MGRYFIGLSVMVILSVACILARGEPDGATSEKSSSPSSSSQPREHLRIAVVDIASLFKRDMLFKAKMDEMKIKVDAAQAELKEEQQAIDAEEKEQKPKLDIESAFPELADNHLDKMKINMYQKTGKQKAEFMREEGVIYYDTMERVKKAIKESCERHDIQLVIRINNAPVDPTDRNDILRGINAPIPYFDSQLDITEEVLTALNSKDSNTVN